MTSGPPPVELKLPVDARSASDARDAVAALGDGLPPTLRADAQLLVSELVTNVVRHAGVGEGGWISIRVEANHERVRVEVRDPGAGFEPSEPRLTPGQQSGWGLFLVDRLASRWGVEHSPTTCAWFEIERDHEIA